MRTLKKLQTEKELNAVLKRRRTDNFVVLYHSLWDDWSKRVVKYAEEWAEHEGNGTIYMVNSWELPQSFSSFSITSTPALVHFKNKKVRVDIEYPKVYNFFHPSPPKKP
jgi:hypothetical protein